MKTKTSCRADSYFSTLWMIYEPAFDHFLQTALQIMEQGQLEQVSQRSNKMIEEQETENPTGYMVADGIARFDCSGVMTKYPTSFLSAFGGTSTLKMREAIRAARQDSSVKAGLIMLDTPGGMSDGMTELLNEVDEFNKVKPMIGHAEDQCCSAGMWLASHLRGFSVGPLAKVGSIGTMFRLNDVSENFRRQGIKPVIVTTANWKVIGQPGTEVTPAQVAELQRFVEATNQPFLKDVAAYSGRTPEDIRSMQGSIEVGDEARKLGLADDVCTTQQTIANLHSYLSSGRSGRFRPSPIRRTAMPLLNDTELSQVRSFPGCQMATAENGFTLLLQKANESHSTAAHAATQNSTLAGETNRLSAEVTRLTTENTGLRSQVGAAPKQLDPSVLAMAKQNAMLSMQNCIASKKLTPAEAESLKTVLIGPDDKPNMAALTPDATGVTLASSVFTALSKKEGTINIREGDNTKRQAQHRQTPGGEQDDEATMTRKAAQSAVDRVVGERVSMAPAPLRRAFSRKVEE